MTWRGAGQRRKRFSFERGCADVAVIVIRPRQGGPGFKYTIPMAALAKLGAMNKDLDPRGRSENVGLVFSFD
jgi:hypothetical protein